MARPGRHSSPGEERLNIALRCCWKLHFTKSSVKFYCTSCCLLSHSVSAIQLQGELALCLGAGHLSVSDRRQRKFSKQRKNSVGVSSSSDINGPWSSVGCLLKSDLLNHQDSHPSEKTTAQKKPFFKNVIRHFFQKLSCWKFFCETHLPTQRRCLTFQVFNARLIWEMHTTHDFRNTLRQLGSFFHWAVSCWLTT